jgi:Ca2+/Na+ antiporter
MDISNFGSILGPIIGVLGGAFGTYCSIKNTETPAERRLMVKGAVLVWLSLCFLAGLPLLLWRLGVIPGWSCWVSFSLFFVLLVPMILYINRRQSQLRSARNS